ncbi:sensor histidine kinase [Ancylomarina sp. 16SWW S1-10-2]|uniref:sensor histidine kinase n=1 Tax=Ancylomarina sp. 16SWW S1-10-2 TaxID=2499681 RepID=UPI0012AD79BF|nr:histidine kinase [Ancylomarina sp. 16SWW S1-10-2]MRT93526.1 GHKL domain-containing protein [Ancylomarina sp. 16SWW S1-10-2]
MILTQKRSENIVYALLWAMVISLPVFTLKGSEEFNWNRVIFEWIRTLPFLLIFLVNNSLLAPKLLLKKKHIWYFTSISVIVILFSVFNDLSRILHEFLFQEIGQHGNSIRPSGPMLQGRPMMQGGAVEGFQGPPNMGPEANKPFSFLIFENIIISFLVVGFNNAIKLGISKQKEDLEREEKEKIHLKTELSFLRQQISPHFFMNTLNNIHALIEMDQVQAQKSVIELSKLMRYLLNESKEGIATIKNEFEFLNSYIDLMRIRYSDKVKINIDLKFTNESIKIPSLLFISLVENAFKYGVSYSQDSYISINTKQDKDHLYFEIKNSISSKSKIEKGTGVGLVNLKKQLDILFQEQHTFEINENENEYQVKLIIPLRND